MRPNLNARAIPAVAMLAAVAAVSALPMAGIRRFYFWDDTAGASLPIWTRIAEQLRDGVWPTLQLDMWRGGNFPAEAATGIFNPLIVGASLAVSWVNDLATVAWLFKLPFFLLLALGTYLVVRDYEVGRGLAAVAGFTACFTGFTLWSDAQTWVTGFTIFAVYPWVWLTTRRLVRGRGGPIPVILAAGLCVTIGNPYSVFATAIVMASGLLEATLMRHARAAWLLVGSGIVTLLVCVPVYLPFVLTTGEVGNRASTVIRNDEFMRTGVTDLVTLSSPGYRPAVPAFGEAVLTYPGTYLAWFVLILAPWLKLSRLPAILRANPMIYTTLGLWLVLVLAPSDFSFFRWPLRLIPYLYFTVLVLWSVLAAEGLAPGSRRGRWLASGLIVAAGFWFGFGEFPQGARASALLSLLAIGAAWAVLRLWRRSGRWAAPALLASSAAIVAVQLQFWPANFNVMDYDFPTSRAELDARFRSPETVLQVVPREVPAGALAPDAAYQDVLVASMPSVAGLRTPTAYSGVGFVPMDQALCMNYNGFTCPEALISAFSPNDELGMPLVDAMRIDRVSVARWAYPEFDVPPGWSVTSTSAYVTVISREEPLGVGAGTVATVQPGLTVRSIRQAGLTESVDFTATEDAAAGRWMTFARLGWPGYSARLSTDEGDGGEATWRRGPAGLLQVQVPAGVGAGTITVDWHVPGRSASAVAVLLAALLAGALAVGHRVSGRRAHDAQPTS